jgi:ribosomal protein L11 methyltransferase
MILPAWEKDASPEPGCAVIRMDPGPAFGTGKHPTTRMCLQALEDLDFSGPWDMLDVGTGSGLLAVYASFLGARRVTALDTDPEALRWAAWNIKLNNLAGRIRLSSQPLEAVDEKFHVAAANLDMRTILELCTRFPAVLHKGGRLILSGILTEEAPRVRREVEGLGFSTVSTAKQEEWACLVARAEFGEGA